MNSIGALRLLLAGLVVYTHAFYLGGFGQEWLAGWSRGAVSAGHVAVQGFFVLSGWLVASSWRRRPALGRFLWHRLLRLAPALWACLILTAFVFTPLLWISTNEQRTPFFELQPSAAGYVWHNFLLPRSQIAIGPFPGDGPWKGDWNGSLWTLFYEGACYLMVAGLGLAGLLARWRMAGTGLIAALLVGNVLVAALPDAPLAALLQRLYDTPGKLLTLHFLAGAAWALWPGLDARLLRTPWIAGVLAGVLVLSWRHSLHVWLSPFILPPIVLWLSHREWLAGFEKTAGGDYSYGVYLYGYPVQQMLAHFQVHHLGFGVYLGASLLGALGLGLLSWRCIERPALALKSIAWPARPRAATA